MLQDLISKYIQIIEGEPQNSELYKWIAIKNFQENWKSECPDDEFIEMFKKVFAKRGNLIFQNSFGFLSSLAKEMPDKANLLLNYLFEDNIPLEVRLPKYQEMANDFLPELKQKLGKENLNHQQDERTISFLLTLHNPENYYLYKDNVYRSLCSYLGIEPKTKAGEKYFHFSELADAFKIELFENEEIKKNQKIIQIRNDYSFNSDNLLLQDIIYRCLVIASNNERNKELMSQIIEDIKAELNNRDHVIAQHTWLDNDSTNFRQVSVFNDNTNYPLHYEIMLRSDIAWEFHAEGSRKQKEFIEPFIQSYDKGKYKLIPLKHGIKGDYKSGEFHKVSPNERYKIDTKGDKYESMIIQLSDQFIDLYNDTNTRLIEYLNLHQNELIEGVKLPTKETMKLPLNQILYGPPGTGKTYSTIDKVVEICDNEYIANNHQHNKTIYERLVKEGRVIFTTFHQSMGYEDFIEGIKAETDENSNIKYSVKPGTFKRLVNKAKGAKVVEENFEITFEKLLQKIKINNGSLILETTEQAKEFTIYENSKGNIKFHANTEKKYEGVIRKDFLRVYLETGESLDWPSYIRGVAKYMIDELGYNKETKEVKQNYVLIIDEINRGNVSQIIGELITLIEEDKRLGEKNELTVTLPYSHEIFGVPSNLFILGTMNTADRSVESLDTALRRRFSFVEMLPDPSKLVDELNKPIELNGINLQDLLFTINKRIEFLVDRDHTIGHAFFIGIDSIPSLQSTFKNKIIPLLQEYFYGNYYNIELVLGSGFFNKKGKSQVTFALDNAEVDSDGFIYEFKDFDLLKEDEFIQLLNAIKIEQYTK